MDDRQTKPYLDILCQCIQRRGLGRIVRHKLCLGVRDELLGNLPTALQADKGRVRGLGHLQVLSSCLSKLLGRCGYVQNVIDHLERQANGPRVLPQAVNVLLHGAPQDCAADDGRLQKGCGLMLMDVFQGVQTDAAVSLRLDVHDLPSNESLGSHRLSHLHDDLQHALGIDSLRLPGNILKRKTQQGISRKNRHLLPVYLVIRGLPTPEVIVVHRGEVVVDE